MLQQGDVIELCDGDRVYGDLPESLVYANRPGIWKLTHTILTIGKYGIPGGKYIVSGTSFDGGGTAMANDIYPDGHHVYCFNIEQPHIKVDFYQSGCFTAMLPEKCAIGKAVQSWRVAE